MMILCTHRALHGDDYRIVLHGRPMRKCNCGMVILSNPSNIDKTWS